MPDAFAKGVENTEDRAEQANIDQEILSGIGQGGSAAQKAFNRLVMIYQQRLYYTIRRMVDNHEDTDDILQETFLKAYRKIEGFRGESSLYTWLYKIAVNMSINHLRKRKIRKLISLDQAYWDQKADRALQPDRITESSELHKLISEAKDRLPAKQKAVFVLRFYEQLSNREIADITGTAEGTVKANYFFALSKIRDYLGERP